MPIHVTTRTILYYSIVTVSSIHGPFEKQFIIFTKLSIDSISQWTNTQGSFAVNSTIFFYSLYYKAEGTEVSAYRNIKK